jgi:hypothetical protein
MAHFYKSGTFSWRLTGFQFMARLVGKCAEFRYFPTIRSEGNLVSSSLGRHLLESGMVVEKCAIYPNSCFLGNVLNQNLPR